MTDTATPHRRSNGLRRVVSRLGRDHVPATQTGAALFPHVVWAHYQWERMLHQERAPDEALTDAEGARLAELEQAYQAKVDKFQQANGRLDQVYWSTKSASAVAITVKGGKNPRADPLRLRERDDIVRFHRVTDWVTRDAPLVAELLHECDLLASRVEQVLRGTSERIAMRWILGIAMRLLGFLERDTSGAHASAEERACVEKQRRKLTEVQAYYHRAASQAGRIVYVSGMLIGLLLIVLLAALATWVLGTTDMSPHHRKLALLCLGAGATGALVSTVSRMGAPDSGKFNVDFELGRPLIRRLGVFRPFVGAIFGLVLFALLTSGLLDLRPSAGPEPYYYGFAAFVAGFSERFATGMLGTAEKRLAPLGAGTAGAAQSGTATTTTTAEKLPDSTNGL